MSAIVGSQGCVNRHIHVKVSGQVCCFFNFSPKKFNHFLSFSSKNESLICPLDYVFISIY